MRCWKDPLSLFIAVVVAGSAFGQTLDPGFSFSPYATVPAPPMQLSFNAAGELFVAKSGPNSFIRRIGPGGAPVETFGPLFPTEPISVQVDRVGAFSGTPGSVIAGGRAYISRIDGATATNLVTYSEKADGMAFDNNGRLLFADSSQAPNGVYEVVGAAAPYTVNQLIVSGANRRSHKIAVDGQNRFYTAYTNGTIGYYEADGTEISYPFVTLDDVPAVPSPAIGPGGIWGNDLYVATNPTGTIVRIDAQGNKTTIGSGFEPLTSIAFGPDGALYVGQRDSGTILRIVPEPGALAALLAGWVPLIVRRHGGRLARGPVEGEEFNPV